ncbi:MAG: hypothetical protein LBT05_14895 [Planctomycetaceae bacterium]|jgi:hypothetical protein|nr:hypothetical protein [Planctomycetaceae bacterium]
MQTFKDNTNRDWGISLTIGSAMLVKEKLGVDLLQPETGDPPLMTRLGTDEMLLAQVIATLLESQFELHKIDANQIYQSFDGATFARAHEAFYKELIDFFQNRGRPDRAKAASKQMKMIQAGVQAAMIKIDGIEVETVIEQAMAKVNNELKMI